MVVKEGQNEIYQLSISFAEVKKLTCNIKKKSPG